MKNDLFWKIFSVLFLIAIIVISILQVCSNRYVSKGQYYILDHWTGNVYTIKEMRSPKIIRIYLPGYDQYVEFPEDTKRSVIKKALQRDYPDKTIKWPE